MFTAKDQGVLGDIEHHLVDVTSILDLDCGDHRTSAKVSFLQLEHTDVATGLAKSDETMGG